MDVDPLPPTHDSFPPEPELPEPPPPILTPSGRPYCECRLPRRFMDTLPEALAPAFIPQESQIEAEAPGPICHVLLIVRDRLITTANSFGIWWDYPHCPTIDPDGSLSLEELSNSHQVASKLI